MSAFTAAVAQFLRARQQIPEQHTGNDGLCGSRTQGGTAHTQSGARKGELYACNAASACRENQKEIEYHIQHAHDDTQQTGNTHTPTAAQHAASQKNHLQDGQKNGKDEKIDG